MTDGPAEHPELRAFLTSLRRGDLLSGTVAAIEPFGVFVALDDGPPHPEFPGVGFVNVPELSWLRFRSAADVVRVGQRVTGVFRAPRMWNLEAILSLRALQPDPFASFADGTALGQRLSGRITRLIPIGAIVEVADGIGGLIPLPELSRAPVVDPAEVVELGDEIEVVVTGIDRSRRRVTFSRRQALPG